MGVRRALGSSRKCPALTRLLITLDTPHRGSPFGNLIRTVIERNVDPDNMGFVLNKVIEQKIADERRSATMRDLDIASLTSFNFNYKTRNKARIGGEVEHPVKYWALASDANRDGSNDGNANDCLRVRTITEDETRQITPANYRSGFPGRGTAVRVFQGMYNLLGWATNVTIIQRRNWLGGTTSYARLNQGQAVFQLNDFVVTMNSQAFDYEKLPNFPIGTGAQGHNHNDLADEPVAIGIHQALRTLLIL